MRSRNQPSKCTQLRVTRVFFLSLVSPIFNDRLSSNFHRFVILCICWDTPSEKTGVWQLPIVSSVFEGRYTFSNCQRPVSSVGTKSQQIANLWKVGLNWSSKVIMHKNTERTTPLLHRTVGFPMPEKSLVPEAILRLDTALELQGSWVQIPPE